MKMFLVVFFGFLVLFGVVGILYDPWTDLLRQWLGSMFKNRVDPTTAVAAFHLFLAFGSYLVLIYLTRPIRSGA